MDSILRARAANAVHDQEARHLMTDELLAHIADQACMPADRVRAALLAGRRITPHWQPARHSLSWRLETPADRARDSRLAGDIAPGHCRMQPRDVARLEANMTLTRTADGAWRARVTRAFRILETTVSGACTEPAARDSAIRAYQRGDYYAVRGA